MSPHPLSLFSLRPKNSQAQHVLEHDENDYLLSDDHVHGPMLGIGHFRSSAPDTILAVLGRAGDSDVRINFRFISKLQCWFGIEQDTSQIVLWDESIHRTTQFLDDDGTNILSSDDRMCIVSGHQHPVLVMGKSPSVAFDLVWHVPYEEIPGWIQNRGNASLARGFIANPRHAETVLENELETVPPPRSDRMIAYTKLGLIGSGTHGQVVKAISVDGVPMAVKTVKRQRRKDIQMLRREVRALSKLSHPNVVNYIGSQGWEGSSEIEVFLDLKHGSLRTLLFKKKPGSLPDDLPYDIPFISTFLRQMLQAIDYLATRNILHRDIKPDNILYEAKDNGRYIFLLADFGICYDGTGEAETIAGTEPYMAPEIGIESQTGKVDVWSLFMVMAWILNVDNFQELEGLVSTRNGRIDMMYKAIESGLRKYWHMARIWPRDRASAAQLLLRHYGGDGLSTELRDIEPLTDEGRYLYGVGVFP